MCIERKLIERKLLVVFNYHCFNLNQMCYNPIDIINPTKYVSLRYRDRYKIQVPCGHCAECQQLKSNEWYYRSYQQTIDCLDAGGFVLFDTLTYSDENLPHLSDFMPIRKELDFPCFNSKHVRLFIADLRQKCKRKYGSNFTFFLSSEYGTSPTGTHRPHYHILLYVSGNITPLELSTLISDTWKYGLTDGLPYKTSNYVLHNVFTSENRLHSIRVCRYVSKYVQKNCKFQKEINRRVNLVMYDIAQHYDCPDDWMQSVHAKRVRQTLKRRCNQFHRQSTQFGAGALANIDLNNLYKTGSLLMPDPKHVVLNICLPTYYKRKLFYKQVVIDGNKVWTPTEEGLKYLAHRERINVERLSDRFRAVAAQFNLKYDCDDLANYVYYYRGRINADNPPSTLDERMENISLFNYVTMSDKEHLGKCGLVTQFIGNNTIGYRRQSLGKHVPLSFFISHALFFDETKEKTLVDLYSKLSVINDKKQGAYELKQYLVSLYASLCAR